MAEITKDQALNKSLDNATMIVTRELKLMAQDIINIMRQPDPSVKKAVETAVVAETKPADIPPVDAKPVDNIPPVKE